MASLKSGKRAACLTFRSSANEAAGLIAVVGTAPKREKEADPEEGGAQTLTDAAEEKLGKREKQVGTVGEQQKAVDTVGKLETRLPLSAPVGRHHVTLSNGQLPDTGNEKLAENNHNRHPEGAEMHPRQVNVGRADQNLVRQGVDELAEVRHLIELAGQITVEEVGNGADDESPECNAARKTQRHQNPGALLADFSDE